MVKPNVKLAASLAQLEKLQSQGRRVFRSGELTRVHRERLVRNGFLLEVMKGWLFSSTSGAAPGDSTPWFASFWEFCANYCAFRFGSDWHLSPEQSLLHFAENTVIPQQVIIYAPKGSNNKIELPFDTSLYDFREKNMPPDADLTERDGLRLLVPEAGLVRVPEAFFLRHPLEAEIVLSSVSKAGDVLGRLLDGSHSVIAGRLIGAFSRIGRDDVANEILSVMKRADYDVRETNPFKQEQAFDLLNRTQSPIVARLQSLWEKMRETVIATFPVAPGLPDDTKSYMSFVDGIYRNDAYHSLSIEGYRVTQELIDRVRAGNWSPDKNEADKQSRNALAARGYWQAFKLVRTAVSEIIDGAEFGALVGKEHSDWYSELFQPCIAAGVNESSVLTGYRNTSVYLSGSRYIPPRWEVVSDAMNALFDLLEKEAEPSVRAVLGHWMFGYIHPYPDGNGRMARFVMNAALASGGYPWTIIRVEDRNVYMTALESASINQNIAPFAQFIANRVARSLEQSHEEYTQR